MYIKLISRLRAKRDRITDPAVKPTTPAPAAVVLTGWIVYIYIYIHAMI